MQDRNDVATFLRGFTPASISIVALTFLETTMHGIRIMLLTQSFLKIMQKKTGTFFCSLQLRKSLTRVKQRVEKLTAVATLFGGFLAPLPGRTFCNDPNPGFRYRCTRRY